MSQLSFDNFFQSAAGYAAHDYKRRLAGGEPGQPCASQLLNLLARVCKQNRSVFAKG